MTPGFHTMTAAEYHADCCPEPSLSSSIAVDLVTRSPAHARLKHPRLNDGAAGGAKETKAMALGSVVHELALGKGGGFAIWEGSTWQGKAAGDFWDQATAEGKTPIKRSEYSRAEKVVDSMRSQLRAMGLEHVLNEGESEQVAVWKDRGHWMRAMFDKWFPDRGEIWDIKTTGKSAHPDAISRLIPAMHYDMRSEFYLMGAEAITGKPAVHGGLGYCFLFVEVEPPFCITPCYVDAAFRERGRRQAAQAVELWAQCMDSGHWPGYANGTVEITAPGWVDFEIGETEISTSGDKVL